MDSLSAGQISESFLCRLSPAWAGNDVNTPDALKGALLNDMVIDDQVFAEVLAEAQQKKIIRIQNDAAPFFTITDPSQIGVQRLIRKFCKRYYGEVSPAIDRKTIQAVLKRHGANFNLDDPGVLAELRALENEGLIKLLDREDACLKMLGSE